jgi:hypothetical protein
MGQWVFNLTDSMEAEVQETIQRMDTLGWTVPEKNPSAQWSMKARPQPVSHVGTTSARPGIDEAIVGAPSQPLVHDIDGHGLDPSEVAIIDGVVHSVVDAALGRGTCKCVPDLQ